MIRILHQGLKDPTVQRVQPAGCPGTVQRGDSLEGLTRVIKTNKKWR